SEKGFTESDIYIWRMLAPIISNRLYMEREYEEQRKEKEILEAFASKNETGLILLDQNYDVIYMNPAIREIQRETNVYKSVGNFVEDIISGFSNRSSGPSMLRLQGYKIQFIGHQELFLSKESRYAIVIERSKIPRLQESDLLHK